jgi:type IV secretion system protein VirD4
MKTDIEQPFKAKRKASPALPEEIMGEGILVAWSLEDENKPRPMGFHYDDPRKTLSTGYLDPVLFDREGHLMTIAPTGAGKGVGCIIPTLLRYPGPVIVIDPKGENYWVTARRRKEMGHEVVLLDPMGITGSEAAQLNPLDLIDAESLLSVDDTAALINVLWHESPANRDVFWINRASQIIIATVLHVLTDLEEQHHNFSEVGNLINQMMGDATQMREQMMASRHPEVKRIASMLLNPARETMGGIISFAQEALNVFKGPLVERATAKTSFDLNKITSGEKVSIYIVMPPHMLESHGQLLKLWVSVLMRCLTRRKGSPDHSTLFLLDEAAQLGHFPQLRQAITLMRGYGVKTWSFWQDVSQLKRIYAGEWETMINNCSVLQTFGANNFPSAKDMSALTGFYDPYRLLDMSFHEMVLQVAGDEAVIAQRPNYLTDPVFAGTFDDNPLRGKISDSYPEPTQPKRLYIRPRKELLAEMKNEDPHLLHDLLLKWKTA